MTIIKSLLDNDLYKFTMLQAFLHYERNTTSKYEFICRTPDIKFKHIFQRINEEVDSLCSLQFSADELHYLGGLEYIQKPFISFLKTFKLNRNFINIELKKNEGLKVEIEAPIVHASLFEVPVLSIISELYSKSIINETNAMSIGSENLAAKLNRLSAFPDGEIRISDFGTRRRYSFEWQGNVIERLIESGYPGFLGTSNVYYARKYGIKPIGTMAHEWIMAHAGITGIEESTRLALRRWLDFYNAKLGIALTDTYTTNAFLKDFDYDLARSFAGVRHDSGNWYFWGRRIISHYKKMNIDPASKILVFSDSLNLPLIEKIYKKFRNNAQLIFGLGTNLTNDAGFTPLQIVIKMIECNGRPLIKISDDKGKILCHSKPLKNHAFSVFGIEN